MKMKGRRCRKSEINRLLRERYWSLVVVVEEEIAGEVAQVFNPSTREAEVDRSLGNAFNCLQGLIVLKFSPLLWIQHGIFKSETF
jgi:hypothetical protein